MRKDERRAETQQASILFAFQFTIHCSALLYSSFPSLRSDDAQSVADVALKGAHPDDVRARFELRSN